MTTVLDPVLAPPAATAPPAGPMSVLHVSTYADHGGSGRAAYRIHQELLRRGWSSKMLVARKLAEDPDVAPIAGSRPWRLLDRACAEVTDRLSLQYWFVPSSYRLARHPWFQAADIVHLYNIHGGYFSYPALIPLSRRKPIVWHLSDMWSFTGHCSYSYDCTRWQTGCGACPMLKDATPLRRDTTTLLWQTKQWVYQRAQLAIVVRSRWMGRQVQQSPLLRHLPVHLVRNGVDMDLFHPMPVAAARQVLQVPSEGKVVFFSADSILDPRKGAARLREALARFAAQAEEKPLLLVAGHGADAWARQSPLPVKSLGYVADQRILAAAYAAADVFVLPSRGDNAPNGLLESMACGTPAVTFDVGGCGEIVRHRETGYLADPDDADDFARGIAELLGDNARRQALGRQCREVAVREYSMTVQVDRYADVYRQVRDRWRAGTPAASGTRRTPPAPAGARPDAGHMVRGRAEMAVDALRVVQLNTWNRVGGAARVAERLQVGLRRLGHHPRELAGYGTETGGVNCVISGWPAWKRFIRRAVLWAEEWLGLQYLLIPWSGEFVQHPWVREADVVQLHNLHGGYISHTILPELSRMKPVVWTLHDMWPLTGHCSYAYDCTRWQSGCGACPDLTLYPDIRVDRTAHLWRRKQALYAKSRLTIVTPSRWLAGLVKQSEELSRFPVHHIPNGIDLDRYRPVPKMHARAMLGLPQEMPLILFIAEYLSEPRKGGLELAEALARLPRELTARIGLMTVGRDAASLRLPESMARFDLGFIENDALLPEYFSAADVVVCPSRADNLPNTILEAMACGTPAVAFAVGGIPEVVRHMETGVLAAPGNVDAFANGLRLLVEDEGVRQRLAARGVELAREEYSVDLQVQRYVALYRDVASRFVPEASERPVAMPAQPAGRLQGGAPPLTIFSMPKPFRGHIGTIQRNAIRSWALLRPACEVILLGDEDGTAAVARELGVRHLPQVAVNEYGTPRIDSIFEVAQQAGRHDLQCYVNCDIILLSDFMQAVAQAAAAKRRFLMVGQRWNMDLREPLAFGPQWETQLRAQARRQGELFVATGMDYFMFTRGLWGPIPPFAIGRTAWDNWLLYRARAVRAPLIDATRVVMAIHQNHDYAHHPDGARGVWQGIEAKRNLELAGGWPHMFMVKDATHLLTPGGLRLALDHWRLWRIVRTLPALYPDMPAPCRAVLAGVNGLMEATRPLRVKLKLSETFEVPQ